MHSILARCIVCGEERYIKPGEYPKGEHPMCPCGSPMVPVRAES